MIYIEGLCVGDAVMASRDLDPEGADIKKGQLGVCFAEVNYYGDGGGHMVRWINKFGHPAGACNVYAGDVEVIK